MSLSQIELVWVRVGVEWECFWVNLREENKVSESKMPVSESKMAEFKMADFINWVKMNEFESDWISLSQSFVQNGWIKVGRIQDGSIQVSYHH